MDASVRVWAWPPLGSTTQVDMLTYFQDHHHFELAPIRDRGTFRESSPSDDLKNSAMQVVRVYYTLEWMTKTTL